MCIRDRWYMLMAGRSVIWIMVTRIWFILFSLYLTIIHEVYWDWLDRSLAHHHRTISRLISNVLIRRPRLQIDWRLRHNRREWLDNLKIYRFRNLVGWRWQHYHAPLIRLPKRQVGRTYDSQTYYLQDFEQQHCAFTAQEQARYPVSYTHLTLPTKRIV